MRRLPPLSALRAFEAAARHGSFKEAASELAVTPTAISHQIRTLEDHTGLALFDRQVRKVVLTEAGKALYPVLRDGFNTFELALQRLARPQVRQRVTISTTSAFMAYWLAPRIAGFRALHPGIDLELHASDKAVMLGGGGADLAIRYGGGQYAGLVAEPLFSDRFAPIASPDLGVASIADLALVPLIDFRWERQHPSNPTWERWFAAAGLAADPARGQLRFSDEAHAIGAVLAGQGIALLSLDLLAADLDEGRLVQPFGPAIPGHTYHLLRSAGHLPEAHVEAALEWLRNQAAWPAGALGQQP